MNASVEDASFHAKYLDNSRFCSFLLPPPPFPPVPSEDDNDLSARKALHIGPDPANIPVSTRVSKNCLSVQHLHTPYHCRSSPRPLPVNVQHSTALRPAPAPARSLTAGQSTIPHSIPSGYAEESDPRLAPTGRSKCFPSTGWMGEVMVKPRRLRKDASSTAGTDRSG